MDSEKLISLFEMKKGWVYIFNYFFNQFAHNFLVL